MRISDWSSDVCSSDLRRPDMSLSLVTRPLSEVLGRSVMFISDSHGPDAERAVAMLAPGDIAILENTRFEKGEEKNDPALADAIAGLGDFYVNDAFSTAHRAQDRKSTRLNSSH